MQFFLTIYQKKTSNVSAMICKMILTFGRDVIIHGRKQAKQIVFLLLLLFLFTWTKSSVHLSVAADLTIQSQFTDHWILLKGIVIELCDELHLHTLEQHSFFFSLPFSLTPFVLLLSVGTHNSLSCPNWIS